MSNVHLQIRLEFKAPLLSVSKMRSFTENMTAYLLVEAQRVPENWILGIMYGLSTLVTGTGSPVAPLGILSERSQKRIASLETVDIRKHTVSQSN